ncbi:hypothetical protein ACTHSJ_33770 [Paenibacillus cellulositrophicus]|uniref:hypothetical protein n=1 Tax=Paenibacillus cellulositrophicus TaxID=562959 RepID=UPI003F7E50CA
MSVNSKDLLMKMKEEAFVYDTSIGKALNKKHDEDKQYVLKILDLLHLNFDRVKYVEDLSSSNIGRGKWAVMISAKFAMMDKRIPIPQVPFHIKIDGHNELSMNAKSAYFMLIGFFQELDDEIYVFLNFKNNDYRNEFKALVKEAIEK